jgi:hypothetical protein
MAEEELVVTRQRCMTEADLGHTDVRELIISQNELQTDYSRDPQATYRKSVQLRPPCDPGSALLRAQAHPPPCEPHPVLCELLESEKGRPSFSLLVLSHIKPHHRKDLEQLEPSALTHPMAIEDMPFLKQACPSSNGTPPPPRIAASPDARCSSPPSPCARARRCGEGERDRGSRTRPSLPRSFAQPVRERARQGQGLSGAERGSKGARGGRTRARAGESGRQTCEDLSLQGCL